MAEPDSDEPALLVRGARDERGGDVSIRCVGGRIVAVGPDVAAAPGDRVLDAGGGLVLPGLVNGHTHAAMTLFRGYGDDLPLHTWLQTRIWPAERRLTPDDVYWGTRLAAAEMTGSGTTTFWDQYFHADVVAAAAAEAGMRVVAGIPVFDGGPDADAAARKRAREDTVAALDALEAAVAASGGLARAALTPHAIYTVSPETLSWLAGLAAERGVSRQIHLSETEDEVTACVERHGCRPAQLLDRCGFLGPGTVLAHGCWLDDAELALIADAGATVVTNPVSNMKLAVGRHFPYPTAVAAGVDVGLGTDGAASNNSLDLLQDVKAFALVQKFAAGDPSVLPAAEALAVATGQRSAALGGHRLEVGAPADLVVLRAAGAVAELTPGDPVANAVYAATGADVRHTVVAGRAVVVDGEVAGLDEVLREAARCAATLTAG